MSYAYMKNCFRAASKGSRRAGVRLSLDLTPRPHNAKTGGRSSGGCQLGEGRRQHISWWRWRGWGGGGGVFRITIYLDYIFTDSEDAQKEDEMQTELSMEDLKEAFRWIWGIRFQSWHIDWIYFWLKIVWWSGARIHHCHPIPGEKWRSTHNFAEHNVWRVCILANLHRVGHFDIKFDTFVP